MILWSPDPLILFSSHLLGVEKELSLKDNEANGMTLEELAELISSAEVTVLKSQLLDREKEGAADPLKPLSAVLKVDVKGKLISWDYGSSISNGNKLR